LRRNYGVFLDSDRQAPGAPINQQRLAWKQQCETEGGKFYLTRKREVENYLHPETLRRVTGRSDIPDFGDFDDVAQLIPWIPKKDLTGFFKWMTVDEIMERDRYIDDAGNERHELVEMIQDFLSLC